MKKLFANNRKSLLVSSFALLLSLAACLYFGFVETSAKDANAAIENALFVRQEFFGASAIVPLPTSEARENLSKLAESQPENREILAKLAQLDEQLSRFEDAEKNLIRLAGIDFAQNENLANFYHRRAQFENEAKILRKILFAAAPEKRAATFERLIDLARVHDLKAYLNQEFYAEVVKQNPDVSDIFERLIEKLVEEKNYVEALNFVRQARPRFPERAEVLLEKEISILLETNQTKEAVTVYKQSFDPFWSDSKTGEFYQFLSEQDQLRLYGAELKNRIKQNPADFDASIRYALYRKHDYGSGDDSIAPVILKLEQAKTAWTMEELVTVTRILLKENEGEMASRFLYTLYLRDDFKANKDLRAKVLYQLFEMFSDAENQRLPVTKGDLRFYEDVAQADSNPGITTGILSLIFSDTNPRRKLENQETQAIEHFNRAAAHRIFLAYKAEFQTSPELAQMYLDIVRLYTATKDTETAEKTLNEFASKYDNSTDFPAVALKLADAFAATKQTEKQREIYQRILDYLGKQGKTASPDTRISTYEQSKRNDGINIPARKKDGASSSDDTSYYSTPKKGFSDYIGRKNLEVTYSEVLEKLVESLAKDKNTSEILALYSKEIQKYSNEEWLYEQRLGWLEQTNLIDEQLKAYQTALARFQSRTWQDKLARFFLREKRNDDFSKFSIDLINKLDDVETANYLSQFTNSSANEFEKQIRFKLYDAAHKRFPHNTSFVTGLLDFYKTEKRQTEWRELCATHYFESPEIRKLFLDDLAANGEIRDYLQKAKGDTSIYELFRADASAHLSNYENAVAAYRKLNRIYPNSPEFAERLINFTRSFGQENRAFLIEASTISRAQADFEPSSAAYRTRSGEIFAELGDYKASNEEWQKLLALGAGDKETYLNAATLYWDYFQYSDAIATIKTLRGKFGDDTLYAFETGTILEAQGKKPESIREYVKALDAKSDETQKEKAKTQLAYLIRKSSKITNADANKTAENQASKMIQTAFADERAARYDASFLVLGYAEFLMRIKRGDEAAKLLNATITQSQNKRFLEAAKDFYETEKIASGEQIVLKRLAETTSNPRQAIQYNLDLATNFEENQDRNAAKNVLAELVRKYPTNFGVLSETADFYQRLGFENESIAVLQNALPKSRGKLRNSLSQKLATRFIRLEKLDAAEQLLFALHKQNKANAEVFGDLARVYVRRGDAEKLRKTFGETIDALQRKDVEKRELDEEIADLRTEMIDAFTRLKDYKSAIEQHIEIINRDPEDEKLVENAIRYVKRYGGAETLLSYYQKVSAEAFKNYRWNVVLARIYESKNDPNNAVKNYQAAITNQPEMPELYAAIADIETKRNNLDEALKNLNTVLELTDNEPEYVKKKIEVLKKAKRFSEIEAETAKLPAEEKSGVDEFAEARKLEITEREKAREIYKTAFDALLKTPLKGELKAADVSGYVRTIRDEEPLNQTNERLWTLRAKLVTIANTKNSTDAGEARKRLTILNGAIIETIGTTAKTVATDEELAALHENLNNTLTKTSFASDEYRTVSLIQDLSRRAGFGDLEEAILLKKMNESNTDIDKAMYQRNLIDFYIERGAYQKTLDFAEKTVIYDLSLRAEIARLAGNKPKELEALRSIYWIPEKTAVTNYPYVARYLQILRDENRDELKSLTVKHSANQLQLINFLLGAGEREFAHAAIENSTFSKAWKVSRHAETSLALKEFDDSVECYFCDALQFDSIGEMTRQIPDKKRFLINDDWFRLTREYGEWVTEKGVTGTNPNQPKSSNADKYLVAMTENNPRDDEKQFEIGVFYLERNRFDKAIEHLRFAANINETATIIEANQTDETEDLSNDEIRKLTTLGAAYYKNGERELAEKYFTKAANTESIEDITIFFNILQKHGLAAQGYEKLPPVIVKSLQTTDVEDSKDFQNLIRAVAESFKNETEKSAYFLQILKKRPTDESLAKMLVTENLIAKNQQSAFYELLIARAGILDYSDYNFEAVSQRTWAKNDVESVYDHENDYKIEEPTNARFEYQKQYALSLVEGRENSKAVQVIASLEKDLNGRYARPEWLRLAKIRLQIRDNKFNLPEIERFVGITVADSVPEIKPPSVERFNDVLKVLNEENRKAESAQISEAFFARMLALERFDAANFVGISRILFQKNDVDKALRVLRLMIDANDEAKSEVAKSEIASLEIVKTRIADAAKFDKTNDSASPDKSDALKIAAETAFEFKQIDASIAFRRELFTTNPLDFDNKVELAKLLIDKNEKSEAVSILNKVVDDKNSARSLRWKARMILLENGENPLFKNAKFDSLSQFYNGLFAVKTNRNGDAKEFFINSIIADKDAETDARQQLIKLYASSNNHFAALKIAETDKASKSDELLQILSESAEKVGNFSKAIEFEKAKSGGENANRIQYLQNLSDVRNRRATDFTVDLENTKKL